MQSSNIPTKIQLPFAKNAGGAYIRTVPVASQIGILAGAASYNDGFPPLNTVPPSAGGVNPSIQDMNGILNELSALLQWYSAGGPISYDATFQTEIGGYPKGALVQSAVLVGVIWQSTTENNVTNPDTGGAGWIQAFAPPAGSVFAYAGTTLPAGYLNVPLTPTLVSTTTYANLFAALQYTYGGSGASFGLPYLASGYVPVQGTLGAITHGALLAHIHGLTNVMGTWVAGGAYSAAAPFQNSALTPSVNSTGGTDNLAAGMGMSYIVKY